MRKAGTGGHPSHPLAEKGKGPAKSGDLPSCGTPRESAKVWLNRRGGPSSSQDPASPSSLHFTSLRTLTTLTTLTTLSTTTFPHHTHSLHSASRVLWLSFSRLLLHSCVQRTAVGSHLCLRSLPSFATSDASAYRSSADLLRERVAL